jgi:hypothetical protein
MPEIQSLDLHPDKSVLVSPQSDLMQFLERYQPSNLAQLVRNSGMVLKKEMIVQALCI